MGKGYYLCCTILPKDIIPSDNYLVVYCLLLSPLWKTASVFPLIPLRMLCIFMHTNYVHHLGFFFTTSSQELHLFVGRWNLRGRIPLSVWITGTAWELISQQWPAFWLWRPRDVPTLSPDLPCRNESKSLFLALCPAAWYTPLAWTLSLQGLTFHLPASLPGNTSSQITSTQILTSGFAPGKPTLRELVPDMSLEIQERILRLDDSLARRQKESHWWWYKKVTKHSCGQWL